MLIGPLSYEFYLKRIADIHFFVGILEFKLRIKIPVALSSLSRTSGYPEWFDVLPKSDQNIVAISQALKRNSQSIVGMEHYLPFSFWSHMFQRELYSILWVPCLHRVFGGLNDPIHKNSFLAVSRNMRRASRVRNRSAHFNLINAGDYDDEISLLKWLIRAIDGPRAS